MPSSKADLLLHPVRLRIITAISTYRMTAKELAEALPDVPQTTLYRHLNTLVEGGILKIVEENPIRGTVERVYVVAAPPSLTTEDLRGLSKSAYEEIFIAFLSTLMSDARHYLDSKPDDEPLNPIEDGVEIDKIQLFLNDEEYQEMNQQIQRLMLAAARNTPGSGRRRRIFASLFIPVDS